MDCFLRQGITDWVGHLITTLFVEQSLAWQGLLNIEEVDDADIVDYPDGNNDNATASGDEEALSEMAKMSLGPAWRWGYLS